MDKNEIRADIKFFYLERKTPMEIKSGWMLFFGIHHLHFLLFFGFLNSSVAEITQMIQDGQKRRPHLKLWIKSTMWFWQIAE
jgi:hypothetical protein